MEDQRTHGECGIRLNLWLRIGESLEEEREEGFSELSRSSLHSVDNLGEGTDGSRSVGGGSIRLVVGSHVGLEGREELGEIGTESTGEGANEVASSTDESGIVF